MDSCPTCKKPVPPRAKNPSAPFCSARCRQVDLGKWLNEEHRVPGEPVTQDDEAASGEAVDARRLES
jgi:endogenous inhibitor of DNA gyrase (YacG/DUF329 family)